MRTRTTFMKRQKELARQQKQREKAARRQQRKAERPFDAEGGNDASGSALSHDEMADAGDSTADDAAGPEASAVPQTERKETP